MHWCEWIIVAEKPYSKEHHNHIKIKKIIKHLEKENLRLLCHISLNKKNKTETIYVQYRIYNNRTFYEIYAVVNFLSGNFYFPLV